MANIFYLDNDGDFQVTDDISLTKAYEMLQRLATFKTEKPLDYLDGIDYLGVFNGYVILDTAIEEIIKEYYQYFNDIIYDIIDYKESIMVEMQIVFKEQGKGILKHTLKVG